MFVMKPIHLLVLCIMISFGGFCLTKTFTDQHAYDSKPMANPDLTVSGKERPHLTNFSGNSLYQRFGSLDISSCHIISYLNLVDNSDLCRNLEKEQSLVFLPHNPLNLSSGSINRASLLPVRLACLWHQFLPVGDLLTTFRCSR